MCGILGAINPNKPEVFSEALDRIKHRGPDGTQIWKSEDGEVRLGFQRLGILDLNDRAMQPMHRGDFVLVMNGEIYNYVELRVDLEKKGHQFQTESDSEVLLAAYQQWGSDCLEKLNGMWAFAIWNKQDKTLFLSRDRFGKKPLYYIQQNGQFIFASEMKALTPFLERVEVSDQFGWMTEHLFDYEPTDQCLIKGVHRFPARHFGILKDNQLQTHQYWNTLDHLVEAPKSYDQQVEMFREIFLDACRIRMRSDVPIGTALSGGIDSSCTIAGMAQAGKERELRDWQHAFVASYPNTPLDESRYAKQVTDHLGIEATMIEPNPGESIKHLEEYLWLFEELYITSPVPMIATYKAARQHGVYVTVDGHGADELFSGYATFCMRALKDCGLNPFAIRSILNAYKGLVEPDQRQFKLEEANFKNYLRWAVGSEKFSDLLQKLPTEIKKALHSNEPPVKRGQKITSPDELGFLNSSLYDLFHTSNLPTLLRNYDHYSMASGVEIRMPFMDHRLVSFCFSLPWSSKIRKGYTKTILRDAMEPFLPESITWRSTKMGFQTPIVDWLKGPWKEYFTDLVHSNDFNQSDFVDSDSVKNQIMDVIKLDNVTYRQGELAYAGLAPFLWEKFVFKKL